MELSCHLNASQSVTIKLIALEVVTGSMCLLSSIGCLAILISFCCYKELRTRARFIVVMLALSVLLYTIANLVGVGITHVFRTSYTSNFRNTTSGHVTTNHAIFDSNINITHGLLTVLCKVQAGVAIYFYVSSIFWTYCIAFYILMSVLQCKLLGKVTFYFFMIVAWLVPALIIGILIGYDYLGYSCVPVERKVNNTTLSTNIDISALWCTVSYNKVSEIDSRILINMMAFDLWLFMGYFILPFIFILVKIAMKKQETRLSTLFEQSLRSSREIDIKLIIIPIAFIILNIWSTVRDILFLMQLKNDFYWLVFLQSVGDCSQGLIIFIIYFLLTKYVREAMKKKCCSRKANQSGYKTITASPVKKRWWGASRSQMLTEIHTVN